jgi:hypothetical protein
MEPTFDLVEKTAKAIFESANDGRAWSDHPQEHLGCRDKARAAIRSMRAHEPVPIPQSDPDDYRHPLSLIYPMRFSGGLKEG